MCESVIVLLVELDVCIIMSSYRYMCRVDSCTDVFPFDDTGY